MKSCRTLLKELWFIPSMEMSSGEEPLPVLQSFWVSQLYTIASPCIRSDFELVIWHRDSLCASAREVPGSSTPPIGTQVWKERVFERIGVCYSTDKWWSGARSVLLFAFSTFRVYKLVTGGQFEDKVGRGQPTENPYVGGLNLHYESIWPLTGCS